MYCIVSFAKEYFHAITLVSILKNLKLLFKNSRVNTRGIT
jgi:hypothetical protein